MNKLFVYGIFLGEGLREKYGMSNPEYAVVPDYVTVNVGASIVEATPVSDCNLGLTGLVVDVDPGRWVDIDRLEGGYDRVSVHTLDGQEVWMYVAKEQYFKEEQE